MMDDIVTTDIIHIMNKRFKFFFGTAMIDSTIVSQCTYVVNLSVIQTNLNIHDNPMNAFIAISHASTTMYECKITKKDGGMKENDRIICNYLVLCLSVLRQVEYIDRGANTDKPYSFHQHTAS